MSARTCTPRALLQSRACARVQRQAGGGPHGGEFVHAVDDVVHGGALALAVEGALGGEEAVHGGGLGLVERGLDGVEHFGEAARVEEIAQLLREHAKLVHERAGVVGAGRGDALQHGLRGDEVLGARVAVELVLQRVLDLLLQVRGDVVAVRDVADARQRHARCEALAEGWHLALQQTRAPPSAPHAPRNPCTQAPRARARARTCMRRAVKRSISLLEASPATHSRLRNMILASSAWRLGR